MGLYTKQFDWEKMWAIADDINDQAAIDAKAAEIIGTFDIEGGANVSDGPIQEMAKYVIAFEQWVKDEEIGLVASHYGGFAQGQNGVGLKHRFIKGRTALGLVRRWTVLACEW